MKRTVGKAYARAGLLGNPSDGYEGKAIAFIIRNFSAEVTIEESDHFEISRGPADQLSFPKFTDLVDLLNDQGCYGGIRLLKAAIKRFAGHAGKESLAADRLKFTMSYASNVPRQVGLAGSSALVTAAFRALMQWFEVGIEPHVLAELTLAAELEDLGIAAGPMDRVIQAYEGVLHMDFKMPRTAASYTRIDPALLPPIFIAYDPRTGEVSGKVHSDVKFRWLRGDPEVREAIAVFPRLVDEGYPALLRGDFERLMRLVDKNFDTRAKIWKLSDRDHEMVRIGRNLGAAVKFCGSGGAVTGVMREESIYPEIEIAYTQAGYKVIRPRIQE
ncbi:GHMP kinase [Candidatus Sumerlaeota bacterium]|nr:GHMP kinase [Candidatus Sumerlaeota bacterium]MBI3736562.1 GHMP kinase [Candidatus Sumerlaeota bacterium]